jgi:hypothetical protein
VKVKLSLSTLGAFLGEVEVGLHLLIDGGLVLNSIPGNFISGKEPGTCCIGGWVWLKVLEKIKYLA